MEIAILFGQSDAENSKRTVVSRRAVVGAWLRSGVVGGRWGCTGWPRPRRPASRCCWRLQPRWAAAWVRPLATLGKTAGRTVSARLMHEFSLAQAHTSRGGGTCCC